MRPLESRIYFSDVAATVLGLIWIVGRALYSAGTAGPWRSGCLAFFIQSTACLLLFLGAAAGVLRHLASD
jgi:glutathione S-transferase